MTTTDIIYNLILLALLAPLTGGLIAGILRKQIGIAASQGVSIVGVGLAVLASAWLCKLIILDNIPTFYGNAFTWAASGNLHFNIGFLLDKLSASMMLVVSIVSLIVHIYSIGYMRGDPGIARFFSYMSVFTFFMLALVAANNFTLLFFGWEGVGLVSYLLIGFWFNKQSAASGSLKAFLVNRVGDFGFILGLAAILDNVGSLDYAQVFAKIPALTSTTLTIFPHAPWSVITVIALCLFFGAMGKSAQIPLHIWLPESMEGPTPISALIHAATMVTAGVYMVARMSPIFEYSVVALSVVLIIGATGALFMGLLGLVENDIKRVIAYSTMSQLGYMMAANGASAFSAGIFHLFTHAFFKALLFLAAGSVIIAMHHEQNIWKMGNLKKYMPITYVTFLIGALALSAIPPFSGYYSKDAIIAAVHLSTIPGSMYAYVCLLLAAFVTALYIFRVFFLVFHTKERMDEETRKHLHESPKVITIPLILLALPSLAFGIVFVHPILYSTQSLLSKDVFVLPQYNVMAQLAMHYEGVLQITLEAIKNPSFWCGVLGIVVAWLNYVIYPAWPRVLKHHASLIYRILANKYGFDQFNNWVFVRGVRKLSDFFFYFADVKMIDHFLVDGSGRGVNRISAWVRRIQSGFLYQYVFIMIVGLFAFLAWLLFIK